jgi:hypothetical protein
MEALLASPVTRAELLLSKLLPYYALGMLSLLICVAVSVWLLHVPFRGSLLSENDIRLAALALPPGGAGLVLVAEDRWAAPLAEAARGVGGRIAAGERIPAHRVDRALASGPERGGDRNG